MKRYQSFFISAAALFFALMIICAARCQDEADGAAKAEWAAAKASGISGLPVKGETQIEFVADRERLKEVMRTFFRRDYPEDKYQAMNALMLKFGFSFFEDEDEDSVVEDYMKGILGVYDEEDKKIYIVTAGLYRQLEDEQYLDCNLVRYDEDPVWKDWWDKHVEDIVSVHEGCHALQDQNFDLFDRREKFKYNDDAFLAQRAMIEGEAEWVEDKYFAEALKLGVFGLSFLRYGESWDMELFSQIDAYIEQQSNESSSSCGDDRTFAWWLGTVPYLFGNFFMMKVEAEKGKGAINESFIRCPLSTEQLMNTDKFFNAKLEDRPTFINFPRFDDLIDTDEWRYLDYNSMGQLKLYLLCRDLYFDATETCFKMAQGWDGDRYTVWRNGDDDILIAWLTTWDNELDAREFYNYYNDAWSAKEISSGKRSSGENWRMVLADENSMYMKLDGNDVIIVEGPLEKEGFEAIAGRLEEAEKYEPGYEVCTMTAADFDDRYPGKTGEDEATGEEEEEEEE